MFLTKTVINKKKKRKFGTYDRYFLQFCLDTNFCISHLCEHPVQLYSFEDKQARMRVSYERSLSENNSSDQIIRLNICFSLQHHGRNRVEVEQLRMLNVIAVILNRGTSSIRERICSSKHWDMFKQLYLLKNKD